MRRRSSHPREEIEIHTCGPVGDKEACKCCKLEGLLEEFFGPIPTRSNPSPPWWTGLAQWWKRIWFKPKTLTPFPDHERL